MKRTMNAAELVSKYKKMGYKASIKSVTVEIHNITKKPTKWIWELVLENKVKKVSMTVGYRSELEAGMKSLENKINNK